MTYGVCSFEILYGGTTRWQRMKRDLPPLIPSPSFIYPPCPSQVFHTIEVYVPYFTNSKAGAFTSHKNLDLLICGVSKQLAWLSHFTVLCRNKPFFPKKKIVVVFTCIWESGLDRLPGCSKWDLVMRVTERTGQTGQCTQLLNRACSPHINRPSEQWRSCETVPTNDFFFILESLTIGRRNKAAHKKKVIIKVHDCNGWQSGYVNNWFYQAVNNWTCQCG